MVSIEEWLAGRGLMNWQAVHYQQPVPKLIEQALAQGYGNPQLASNGALRVMDVPSHPGRTHRTGRSPKDKFIVKDDVSTREGQEVFYGDVNHPMSEETFDRLFTKVVTYLQDRELWVQDNYAGAMEGYRVPVRFVADAAWSSLFPKTLFVRPDESELESFEPEWTVINAYDLEVCGKEDGVNSDAFAAISFARKLVIIGGLHYGGEIKKGIFTVLNYVMPVEKDVFSMHCSVNVDMEGGNTAVFFGLSGTGKTTLSADPARRLIGDDQHGWVEGGVFNYEGGCYAKTIDLSAENEPQIHGAIRFGSILENVPLGPTRVIDYTDGSITQNTRATYPVEHIPDCVIPGVGPEPKNVIFLTCDAFGVLPPVARLSPQQAMYHFLSGFTSKVAGTEDGVTEPQPTFSTCFGAPFMPLHPSKYAEHLRKSLERSCATVWLVNTGWSGGSAADGAKRISIPVTRSIITAIVEGKLCNTECGLDENWNMGIPAEVPGVDPQLLRPRELWADSEAYDVQARKLSGMFSENFKQYLDYVDEGVARSGPNYPLGSIIR